MKRKSFFLITAFVLLAGCINMSVLEKKGHRYVMEVNNLVVEDVKAAKWHVGKRGFRKIPWSDTRSP